MKPDYSTTHRPHLIHVARLSLLLCLLCASCVVIAANCRVGEIWPSSRSVFYPDQAVYDDKYKAIKTHITFGPDAIIRVNVHSEYSFYVIVVRHAGKGTEKAFEGDSTRLGGDRFGYEFTANHRDYPQDEMELLIFAGEHYQTKRFKIDLTYTTIACK